MDVKRRSFLFGSILGAAAAPVVAKAVEPNPLAQPFTDESEMAYTCSISTLVPISFQRRPR
jgi:hypothetical protein